MPLQFCLIGLNQRSERLVISDPGLTEMLGVNIWGRRHAETTISISMLSVAQELNGCPGFQP